jgi:hypothetical protein
MQKTKCYGHVCVSGMGPINAYIVSAVVAGNNSNIKLTILGYTTTLKAYIYSIMTERRNVMFSLKRQQYVGTYHM